MHTTISLFLCLLLSNKYLVRSASLDEFGQYRFVVAIDEDTIQNANVDYVKNIQNSMLKLSELLHSTTDGKFLIKNVDVLVPSHWNVEADETSTSQVYEGADIKISHKLYLPQVNNPNFCGRPGQDITLPYNFFDSLDSGPFGHLWSALLSLFVRLRFGAWEEHGYPGDSSFPYFWKSSISGEWEVNSCTDKPLNGEYRSVIDNSSCGMNSDPLYPPASDCRFFPNDNQEASTSLMSYHYLGSIQNFCDSSTHNRASPTPQNFYCKFKSVKEVIELSSDFEKVTEQPSTYTPPQVRIVKSEKSQPLLYILLDRGATPAPTSVISTISRNMERLISQADLASLTVGVGCFPGLDNTNQPYSQVVPWSSLQSPETYRLINQTLYDQVNTVVGFRNYAAALRDTVLEIKNMQHKAGAAILILKVGPEINRGGMPPEYEVLLPLQDSNIRVYAIEIEGNSIQRGIALENVATKSSGKHLKLSSSSTDIDGLIQGYIDELITTLKTPFPPKNMQLILKEVIEPGNPVIGISPGKTKNVFAYAIPVVGAIKDGVSLTEQTSDPPFSGLQPLLFSSAQQITNWDDPTGSSRNGFYTFTTGVYMDTRIYQWNSLAYECETPNCLVMFVIFAEATTGVDNTYSIKVSSSASATSNVVDLGVETSLNLAGSPYLIYAQIEENGTPLLPTPDLSVIATIYDEARSWSQIFELTDSGPIGFPDLKLNDGIYSGAILPNINDDTNFQIFVTVKYFTPPEKTSATIPNNETDKNTNTYMLQNSDGKLFPIGQDGYFGCGSGYSGCWSKQPDVEFLASAELDGYLRFINSRNYKRIAHRTVDLRYTPVLGTDFTVTLEWTAPRTLLKVGDPSTDEGIDSYKGCHSENLDRLLDDFDNCECFTIVSTEPAGNLQAHNWTFTTNAVRYFALKSKQRVPGQENVFYDSELSNVLAVNFQYGSDIVMTTTTTPAPVTPPSTTTTTTTPPSTTSSGNTPTTISGTRTSVTRETTRVPTTSKTTIVEESTTSTTPITTEKTKHWYEEKTGIIVLAGGAAALLLIIGGGFFILWFFKR